MYEIFTNIYESMDSIFDYFVPLNHLCIPIPASHCFNYCDFGQYLDYC